MKKLYIVVTAIFLCINVYSIYGPEYFREFASASLVLKLSKEKYKSYDAINCHFFLLFSGNEEVPPSHGITYENPQHFKHPSGGYTRGYFELHRKQKDKLETCKYKLEDDKAIKKIFQDGESKGEYEITKLFEIKPGKYKIRFVIETVDAIEEFIKLPKPRDENGNEIEEPEPSEEEKKDLERRRAEVLKKPRKTEILKTSDWVEFEVVE